MLNSCQAGVHKIDLAPSASVLAAKAIFHSDLWRGCCFFFVRVNKVIFRRELALTLSEPPQKCSKPLVVCVCGSCLSFPKGSWAIQSRSTLRFCIEQDFAGLSWQCQLAAWAVNDVNNNKQMKKCGQINGCQQWGGKTLLLWLNIRAIIGQEAIRDGLHRVCGWTTRHFGEVSVLCATPPLGCIWSRIN